MSRRTQLRSRLPRRVAGQGWETPCVTWPGGTPCPMRANWCGSLLLARFRQICVTQWPFSKVPSSEPVLRPRLLGT
eukprot:10909688-Karenia_brevis.AAC.1